MSAAHPYADPSRPGYDACTGCNLCVLPCPVWWQTRDLALTVKGRAKARQGGATLAEIAPSLYACVVCGACEPACPAGIDTVGETLALRAELDRAGASLVSLAARELERHTAIRSGTPRERGPLLLTGVALGADERVRAQALRWLGSDGRIAVAGDDGRDLSIAIEAGLPIDPDRVLAFLEALRGARELIVADGLLHRPLRRWLPGVRVRGLGEALQAIPGVRRALGPTDLYMIETRGYHSDFERLVKVYDRLRVETGCRTNLDLQRIATPTGGTSLQARLGTGSAERAEQVRWLLEGRAVDRVVVESIEDGDAFAAALPGTGIEIHHVAEIAA